MLTVPGGRAGHDPAFGRARHALSCHPVRLADPIASGVRMLRGFTATGSRETPRRVLLIHQAAPNASISGLKLRKRHARLQCVAPSWWADAGQPAFVTRQTPPSSTPTSPGPRAAPGFSAALLLCDPGASTQLRDSNRSKGADVAAVNGEEPHDPGRRAAGEIASVPVAVVTSRIEAELIVGMLASNGLTAVVSADDAGGQQPPLQRQGVRVLVTPSDEAPARRLLAATDDSP